MLIEALSMLVIGLALLLIGSNFLVTSTENFSDTFSISGFIASFFMIGIATSAPEIFVSIVSAIQNQTILAIGNTLGSNISNIALVFCVSVLFIRKNHQKITLPKKAFIGMSLLTLITLIVIIYDNLLDGIDSLFLIVAFVYALMILDKDTDYSSFEPHTKKNKTTTMSIVFYSIAGLVMLIYGSDYFITGATNIALIFGVSTYVIGLTLTALGTSLPELATTIQSARKGRSDFIVGNIIGSNIFNLGIALAIAGLISPALINESEFIRDICMLIFSMIIFYFIIKSDKSSIKTVYSSLLIVTYLLYVILLLS